MDGFFTKIAVSTSCFTMNGVFLTFGLREAKPNGRVEPETDGAYESKYYISFDPYTIENRHTTESILCMEEMILQMYGSTLLCGKTPVFSLKTQLQCGALKIHREPFSKFSGLRSESADQHSKCGEQSLVGKSGGGKYVLKISGVWESATGYGVTYKCTPCATTKAEEA